MNLKTLLILHQRLPHIFQFPHRVSWISGLCFPFSNTFDPSPCANLASGFSWQLRMLQGDEQCNLNDGVIGDNFFMLWFASFLFSSGWPSWLCPFFQPRNIWASPRIVFSSISILSNRALYFYKVASMGNPATGKGDSWGLAHHRMCNLFAFASKFVP